jgi:hypothetical protein
MRRRRSALGRVLASHANEQRGAPRRLVVVGARRLERGVGREGAAGVDSVDGLGVADAVGPPVIGSRIATMVRDECSAGAR